MSTNSDNVEPINEVINQMLGTLPESLYVKKGEKINTYEIVNEDDADYKVTKGDDGNMSVEEIQKGGKARRVRKTKKSRGGKARRFKSRRH